MDRDGFWTLIEAARAAGGGDCRQQTAHLVAALRQRPVDDILALDRILYELLAKSYRWDLWGAAYLINGGCSDDGFDYFRGWLLAQGRATWEAAVRDPDSLAAHPQIRAPDQQAGWEGSLWCEPILYLADDAYQAVTGQELPADVAEVAAVEPEYSMGEDWDFDDNDEMRRRYPKLWAQIGWGDSASHDHGSRPPA
ncbi:MAG TPA: DUF4240 domain-containing protein [Actinomycetes bacterium]|jgi:hypothetical protein|nr:DUF4240 domain-containing protein [Actinomycetes bacterium]